MSNHLRKPFGPYPEDVLLSSSSCKKTLKLHSFKMECGEVPVGFDETEFVARAPDSSRIAQHTTNFYGVVEIDSLDWLSPTGQLYLQKEFRQRYGEGLTLAHAHRALKSPILVWLECQKTTNARFLVSNGFESSLVVNSPKRLYEVISIDAGTFHNSRDFFTRWRLWALIDHLIQIDPLKTPVERRTVDWLVDQYYVRLRKNIGRRFPRHVSRAEIIGIFAAHADWILAQHLVTSAKSVQKLNVHKWISFCKDVAARSHLDDGWGLPENRPSHWRKLDLSYFGVVSKGWERRIKNASRQVQNKSRRRAPEAQSRAEDPEPRKHLRVPVQFSYDSDFSEPSTSSYSGFSDEGVLFFDSSPPNNILSCRPSIRSGSFEWHCPCCGHVIDLLDLKDKDMRDFSSTDFQYLGGHLWTSLWDTYVQEGVLTIIQNHFALHID